MILPGIRYMVYVYGININIIVRTGGRPRRGLAIGSQIYIPGRLLRSIILTSYVIRIYVSCVAVKN